MPPPPVSPAHGTRAPQIDAADIDVRADEALNYVADAGAARVTFAAGGSLYALKFPSAGAYKDFLGSLEVGRG